MHTVKVLSGIETLPKISTGRVGHISVTDDRQAIDGRPQHMANMNTSSHSLKIGQFKTHCKGYSCSFKTAIYIIFVRTPSRVLRKSKYFWYEN